jgi:hypothetical protein
MNFEELDFMFLKGTADIVGPSSHGLYRLLYAAIGQVYKQQISLYML